MEFVLIESLRTGEVTLRRHWRRRWRQGLRLFGFRIAIGLPMIALFAGWLALLIVPILTGRDPRSPPRRSSSGSDGVSHRRPVRVGVGAHDRVRRAAHDSGRLGRPRGVASRLWGSIKTAWKQYLAYVVIAFLLTVAAGIIIASIVVGIVAIVLLIPILIVAAITHVTVSLSSTVGIAVLVALALLFGLSMLVIWTLAQVPVVTYLRYYALLVLGDIEETFHILSDRQLSRREP